MTGYDPLLAVIVVVMGGSAPTSSGSLDAYLLEALHRPTLERAAFSANLQQWHQ